MKLPVVALVALVALVAPLASSAPQAPPAPAPQTGACPQPTVGLPAAIDRVLRDYESGWSQGDEVALASLFTEDGIVMSRGGMPVRGREAIAKGYANSGGAPLALRPIAFASEGSIGLILGCYAAGAGDKEIGKFTLTLKRDATKRWLIFSDMDNGNAR